MRKMANARNPMSEILTDALEGEVEQQSESLEVHVPNLQPMTIEDLQAFAQFIAVSIKEETRKLLPGATEVKPKRRLVDYKDKKILNFSQALNYSGLAKDDLKTALDQNKILAKRKGDKGTWKIHRESLDDYCKNYFLE